jgi:hypothetical protein
VLPDGLLKTFLDRLFRLARGRWRRDERSAFRPRLELLEGRAAPSGLAIAQAPPPPPAPSALVRVSEQGGVAEADPRRLPVLAGRAFEDRLFGDETGDSVRGGKDLDVLSASRLDFTPLPGLGADAWCSGKDDVALIFAGADAAGAADALFIDSGW